jgi:hypothetical protein
MTVMDISSGLVAVVLIAAYFGIPAYLLSRGWPLRAGLGMFLVAFFPVILQLFAPPGDHPFYLLFVTLPLPLLLITIGLIATVIRWVRWIQNSRSVAISE